MRDYMARRYEQRKARAIEQLGGRCARCGSVDDLHFDHVDPRTKRFDICKRLAGISEARLQAELAKCQLLCRPCHDEKSRAEGSYGNFARDVTCGCGRSFETQRQF